MAFKIVGKVRDAHGLKGEIFVLLFARQCDWLKKLKSARLVGPSGQLKELTIKNSRIHQVQGRFGLILTSEEVKDRNEAEALRGYHFEIPQEFLVSPSGDQPFLNEILGMRVEDRVYGHLGIVSDFSSNGAQDLLIIERVEVNQESTESLEIPFVEAFVVSIDYQEKLLKMDLPEGLVDLSLATSDKD